MDQKIMTIIGARPQFIKAAVVSRAFAQKSNLREIIVHTGQHFDAQMSDVFFREMEIPAPSYNLRIDSLGHGAMTGRMMEKLEDNDDVQKVYANFDIADEIIEKLSQ